MKRPDAWHDAYRAIYSTTGCIRLTVAQAAAQMGTSPKRVTQQYPVRAGARPSGWTPCWIRNSNFTEEESQ